MQQQCPSHFEPLVHSSTIMPHCYVLSWSDWSMWGKLTIRVLCYQRCAHREHLIKNIEQHNLSYLTGEQKNHDQYYTFRQFSHFCVICKKGPECSVTQGNPGIRGDSFDFLFEGGGQCAHNQRLWTELSNYQNKSTVHGSSPNMAVLWRYVAAQKKVTEVGISSWHGIYK